MIYEYVFSEIVQTSEKKCLCVDPFLKLYEERRFFCWTACSAAKVFSYVWLLSRKQLYFFASVLLTQKNEGQ